MTGDRLLRTEADVKLFQETVADVAAPAHLHELGRQICEAKARIVGKLAIFREALREFAGPWMREFARATAVAQNTHTLGMGRGEIARLKHEVEEHVKTLDARIADEFTVERYSDPGPVMSGQVADAMARRFDAGIRRVLATIGPVVLRAGYRKDESFLSPEVPASERALHERSLALPPDILDLIGKVAQAITDIKVIEAKIEYFDRERDKKKAAELWDNS